ncbi:MAG TPA: response regulator [Candidatus Angelobacter sp.]|nr:response regulator [Candidatus Angelobacter sp.]
MNVLHLAETSHFCPDLPNDSQSPQGGELEQKQQPSSKIKRVMVVDDEMLIAESLADILRGEGYLAIAVSDGAAAVKWAEFLRPEAIICDIAMPGLDGFEVAKQVRELSPDCRIILFSGHGGIQNKMADMLRKDNDFEFIAKPVKPEIILKMLGDLKTN